MILGDTSWTLLSPAASCYITIYMTTRGHPLDPRTPAAGSYITIYLTTRGHSLDPRTPAAGLYTSKVVVSLVIV
jgi:hypothetical protein